MYMCFHFQENTTICDKLHVCC